MSTLAISSCSDEFGEEETISPEIEVIATDPPYRTEKFHRIGYTIKTWEYEKDNLSLQKIIVLDASGKTELYKIEGGKLDSLVYKAPLPYSKYFLFDKIKNYYIPVILSVDVNKTLPTSILHRFVFYNSVDKVEVIKEGGQFSTVSEEMPIEISSPVMGSNWRLFNQPNLSSHSSSLYLVNGKVHTGERYATDYVKLNDKGLTYSGDINVNRSFFSYWEKIYAVADGKVVKVVDGRMDNLKRTSIPNFASADDLAGNYIVINIGNNRYAIYAHCFPGAFNVIKGDSVKAGQPIALIGNSGFSYEPHLHFQISDFPDLYFSRSIPYILKQFTKTRELPLPERLNIEFEGSMPEENSIVSFPAPAL